MYSNMRLCSFPFTGNSSDHTNRRESLEQYGDTLDNLRAFILDEALKAYPRALTIGEDSHRSFPYNGPINHSIDEGEEAARAKRAKIVSELGDRLTGKVEKFSRIFTDPGSMYLCQTRAWFDLIAQGDWIATARLIFFMFPNIKTMSIRKEMQWPGSFPVMLNFILKKARLQPDLLREHEVLQKLEVVMLSGLYGLRTTNINMCECLMSLPAVREIQGHYIGGPGSRHLVNQKSGVTSLELLASNLTALDLLTLFSKATALEVFKYDYSSCDWRPPQMWEPGPTVFYLRSFAYNTLKRLELTADGVNNHMSYSDAFIGDLRDFQALEMICLQNLLVYRRVGSPPITTTSPFTFTMADASLNLPKPSDLPSRQFRCMTRPYRFIDLLPASAQQFRVVGGLWAPDVFDMLEDLPTARLERLPNLRSIFFEECTRIKDELLLQKVWEVGVSVWFWEKMPSTRVRTRRMVAAAKPSEVPRGLLAGKPTLGL